MGQAMPQIDVDALLRIALVLALGLLIGIQRGWAQRAAADGTRFAGVRTFALLGLAGGICGILQGGAPLIAAVLLAAVTGIVLLGYWRSSTAGKVSGTTSLVAVLTLACGFMAGSGAGVAASVITGLTVGLLALRPVLHRWVASLDQAEIVAIARFALIALVILPLLPDTPFGPYGAWRPRQLWLVVVLVSGFSLLGYLASRMLGASRGILATAAAGSMVSSTAVTAALAQKLRDDEGDPAILYAGAALASAVMFLRVMLLTFGLASYALPTLAMVAVPAMLVSAAWAAWLMRRAAPAPAAAPVAVRNPFALGPALLLMVLVMALTVAAQWVLARYGDRGLAVVLALSGVADVDSAIITLGNLKPGTLTAHIAGLVVVPPILLNTLFKAATAIGIAGWRKGWPAAAPLVASAAVGAAALAIVY